jgi:hypothetical protein
MAVTAIVLLLMMIIIIQFNSLFLCAASTAKSPVTDTAQKHI